MITFTYPNGWSADYDETIKVGDLITCYNEGYHTVTEIEDRPGKPPLYYYVKAAKIDGVKSKRLKGNCCATYCRKALASIDDEIDSHMKAIHRLKQLVVDHNL